MTATHEIAKTVTTPGAAARPPAALARAEAPVLARRLAARLGNEWPARVAWTVGRTGRPGLVGIALLLAAAVFLLSTHLQVVAQVEALRAELATAQTQARQVATEKVVVPRTAARALPARTEMPALLRQLFGEATRARLAIDTGKYEVKSTARGGVVRHQLAFPVIGPYPQIRSFLDATLATMPAVAVGDLTLERKSIADGVVEAQIRMIVYTDATGPGGPPGTGSTAASMGPRPSRDAAAAPPELAQLPALPRASEALPASDRVVEPTHAAALFAQHSWTVLRPQPLPPPPPPQPPPEPTAPPLPYALVGSFAPAGGPPVYFLARGDRLIDARVGDRLDGVYQLESADGGQLVFVYLPLNIRQNIMTGASK